MIPAYADTRSFVPTSLMSASEFAAAAFVVPVRRSSSPASVARLEVPPEHQPRLDAIRKDASASMRAMGGNDLSAQLVTACLDMNLKDDLWHSRLPSGKVVILVREDVFQQLPERDIAEQVHRTEIDAAVLRGESVPPETVSYYRHKPCLQLAPKGF